MDDQFADGSSTISAAIDGPGCQDFFDVEMFSVQFSHERVGGIRKQNMHAAALEHKSDIPESFVVLGA